MGSERWVGGGWAGGRWVAGDGWAVAHRPPLEGLTRNYIEIKGTHHPPVTSNYPPLEETAIVNFSLEVVIKIIIGIVTEIIIKIVI